MRSVRHCINDLSNCLNAQTSEQRLTHKIFTKFLGLFIWRRVTRLTELLALPGNSPSIENYRFLGEMFTWRKRVTRLGEFPVERDGKQRCPGTFLQELLPIAHACVR